MNKYDIEHVNIMLKPLSDRINELEHQITDMNLAISNAMTMFPIIIDRIKKTEETYDVILKFIKLQEKED